MLMRTDPSPVRWYELVCLGFCENNVPAVCSLLLNVSG